MYEGVHVQRFGILEFLRFGASLALCLLAGFLGSIFTTPSIPTWYASLNKPSFNPPDWVFAPVWTTLFILMGVSLYLVWNKGVQNKEVRIALFLFLFQLGLNVLWSYLFFGMHSPSYAFMEIMVLWVAIASTMFAFSKISRISGFLLLPYILWVSFAAILNFAIMRLNP